MTLPHERMRALRWGAELLLMIEHDSSVPAEFRNRAAQLRSQYPAPLRLLELVHGDAPAMPLVWAQAIDDARQLFLDLARAGLGSEETCRQLYYTRRHFAEPALLSLWTQAWEGSTVQHWLLPEL